MTWRIAWPHGSAVLFSWGETPVPDKPAHWHVPSIARARDELGLEETVPIDDAIVRTARWWAERAGRTNFEAKGNEWP